MKPNIILLILASCIFMSCNDRSTTNSTKDSMDTLADGTVLNNVDVGEEYYDVKMDLHPLLNNNMMEIGQSEIFIFPLKYQHSEKNSGIKYSRKQDFGYYWNILFYNAALEESYLLTKEKILFIDFKYANTSGDSVYNQLFDRYCFYTGVSYDYNKNGVLDVQDPGYLYLSDKKGKHFKMISPPMEQVKQWVYLPKKDALLIITVSDYNKDKIFDSAEPFNISEYHLTTGTLYTNRLDKAMKKEIWELYKDNWLPTKDNSQL